MDSAQYIPVCRVSWLVASAHPSVVLHVASNCQLRSTPELDSLTANVRFRLEQFWGKVAELPRLSFFGIYDVTSSRFLPT